MTTDPIVELCDKATVEGLGLLLLIAWTRQATTARLVEITNRDRKTIGRWLHRLESRRLIERGRDGHADAFYLTAEARQMPLPELGRIAPVGGSSSSSFVVIEEFPEETTTTTRTGANRPSCDPESATEIVKFLMEDIGCPSRRIAEEAARAALERGWKPFEAKMEALWWWVYWASGDGKGIDNIGLFIARKIQNDERVRVGYTPNPNKARSVDGRLYETFLLMQEQDEQEIKGAM